MRLTLITLVAAVAGLAACWAMAGREFGAGVAAAANLPSLLAGYGLTIALTVPYLFAPAVAIVRDRAPRHALLGPLALIATGGGLGVVVAFAVGTLLGAGLHQLRSVGGLLLATTFVAFGAAFGLGVALVFGVPRGKKPLDAGGGRR